MTLPTSSRSVDSLVDALERDFGGIQMSETTILGSCLCEAVWFQVDESAFLGLARPGVTPHPNVLPRVAGNPISEFQSFQKIPMPRHETPVMVFCP